MHLREFDEFKGVLAEAFQVFDKPLNDSLLKSYWEALKDQPLASVRRRAEYHTRHGKFCPRPKDLRPPDEKVQPENGADEGPSRARMDQEAKDVWQRALARDPEEARIRLRLAQATRVQATTPEDHPASPMAAAEAWEAQRQLNALWERRRGNVPRGTRPAESAPLSHSAVEHAA